MEDKHPTTLLLIRHGQSRANLEKFFAGNMDVPLTDQGLLQAQKTADYIASEYSVDAVYCSDLCRAFDTGAVIAAKVNVTPLAERALREIDAGQWTGIAFSVLETTFSDSYTVWQNDIGNSHPVGGESVKDLAGRVSTVLYQIAEANPGKTVVVATHATPIRATQWKLSGKDISHMKEIPWVSNASITELFYENGHFRLGKVSWDGHLEGLKSSFPANV